MLLELDVDMELELVSRECAPVSSLIESSSGPRPRMIGSVSRGDVGHDMGLDTVVFFSRR